MEISDNTSSIHGSDIDSRLPGIENKDYSNFGLLENGQCNTTQLQNEIL